MGATGAKAGTTYSWILPRERDDGLAVGSKPTEGRLRAAVGVQVLEKVTVSSSKDWRCAGVVNHERTHTAWRSKDPCALFVHGQFVPQPNGGGVGAGVEG